MKEADFIFAWRKAHRDQVYGPTWQCRLCLKVIQCTESELAAHNLMLMDMVRRHQRSHGQDWLDYERAASPAGVRDGVGE